MRKNIQSWKRVKYGDITVYYLPQLDGGGRLFGQDYIPVVKELFGRVNTICEFACGPGFIGFSLLAHGLCKKLCLVDINQSAINACRKTIKENKLEKIVTTHLSDALDQVPKNEKWDLVVSNPPHFSGSFSKRDEDILVIDHDWVIHKKFYSRIQEHLTPGGSVLFVENMHGSSANTFRNMIRIGGLTFIKEFRYKHSVSKTISENVLFILKRLRVDTLKRILSGKIIIKQSRVASVSEYPLYFIWSKKK